MGGKILQIRHKSDNSNKILHHMFGRAELSYSISHLSKSFGPIVDMVFVGLFIGIDGVTVMSYAGPIFLMFELIGICIGTGTRTKGASLIGEGHMEDANKAFSSSLISGGGLAIIAGLIVALLHTQVAFILGVRDAVLQQMTVQYLSGYLIGVPFLALTRIITPYLQMEGQFKLINSTAILTTVIDIAADMFVIYVLHGGMFEIGLATSLGYIIPFFLCASFFISKKKKSVFRFSFKSFDMAMSVEMIKLGAPGGLRRWFSVVGGVLINNMLTFLEINCLVAAYGVFSQITSFIRTSWYAPADTLHAFCSVFIGEEDKDSIREVQNTAVKHSLIATSILTVLLFVFAPGLASIFLISDDPMAIGMATECIRVSSISLVFCSFVYNFNNYLIAVRRLAFSNLYGFLTECGALVPITFLSLKLMGYHGAWVAKIINMVVLCLIAVLYTSFNKTGSTFREKLLFLPEGFGPAPGDEIAETANSIDDIEKLSKVAVAFALEHGADKTRALRYGLITEELAGILADHGFSDGKEHIINVRLVAKNEDMIIRLRDDCKPFNMTEYYNLIMESQDPEKDSGLAIVMRLSKDVKYSFTFGCNNILVRL